MAGRPSERPDSGRAFLPDVTTGPSARLSLFEDDAEASAEEFLFEATSAEHVGEDARNEVADENGGLHVAEDTALLEEIDRPRRPRGFAAMDRSRVRELARRGGRLAHERGTAHRFSPEEARTAGKKGGAAPHKTRARLPTST